MTTELDRRAARHRRRVIREDAHVLLVTLGILAVTYLLSVCVAGAV